MAVWSRNNLLRLHLLTRVFCNLSLDVGSAGDVFWYKSRISVVSCRQVLLNAVDSSGFQVLSSVLSLLRVSAFLFTKWLPQNLHHLLVSQSGN
jgi:hypothetical protein